MNLPFQLKFSGLADASYTSKVLAIILFEKKIIAHFQVLKDAHQGRSILAEFEYESFLAERLLEALAFKTIGEATKSAQGKPLIVDVTINTPSQFYSDVYDFRSERG